MKYLISFYVPVDFCEQVKKAMFAAGAGKIGLYDSCCWQTLGQGQFRPLSGSQPAVGSQYAINYIEEYKVELICQKDCLQAVINALLDSHPYEEVAYHVIEHVDIDSIN